MLAIAEKIREDCGGKLDDGGRDAPPRRSHLRVRREAGRDHRGLKPELVVQPWTEDPELEPNARAPAGGAAGRAARRHCVSRLADMQAVAGPCSTRCRGSRRRPRCGGPSDEQLAFLGETNLENDGRRDATS